MTEHQNTTLSRRGEALGRAGIPLLRNDFGMEKNTIHSTALQAAMKKQRLVAKR
jgi:hypothetical protein